MEPSAAATLADPRWFPWRFDVEREEYHFAWAPAATQAAVTFLAELRPSPGERRIIARKDIDTRPIDEAPLHLILHSGLGGSTLLARALAQPGVVTTLKEPPILTDVIAYGLGEGATEADSLLEEVTKLLARPFATGEAVVVKMSSVGNGLGAAMAEARPRSRILCLTTPLEEMLASLARRGAEGREAGRRLFTGLRNSGFADLGLTDRQLSSLSQLQLAALAWLAMQRIMGEAALRLGPRQVRSIASGQLLGRPRESLTAIAEHLGLALDVEQRLTSGIFSRHAKTGEPFDAAQRKREVASALHAHGGEIGRIVDWARKVAEANAIAWDLPCPLFD